MRILIIEDDPKVSGFLQKGLREEDIQADVCRSGLEAIEPLRKTSYDLIILDIMLPGVDGFTVCRELRQQGILVPVLMLTARDTLQDKITGFDQGADDYLTKPFSFEELLARIRALQRRYQGYRAVFMKAGDLEMDPMRRQVTRAGQRIQLTSKEYSLLEYLLRNKNQVVSPTQIIEHVWEMDFEGSSNLVNVYINHLREKIDRHHPVKLIRTLRGQGYCLDDHEAG